MSTDPVPTTDAKQPSPASDPSGARSRALEEALPGLAVLREKAGDGSTDFFVEVRQSDLAALLAGLDERDELVLQNEACGNAVVALEEALRRAVWLAKNLHAMIGTETWRASGGDDGQGHYEGEYHAAAISDELDSLAALVVVGRSQEQVSETAIDNLCWRLRNEVTTAINYDGFKERQNLKALLCEAADALSVGRSQEGQDLGGDQGSPVERLADRERNRDPLDAAEEWVEEALTPAGEVWEVRDNFPYTDGYKCWVERGIGPTWRRLLDTPLTCAEGNVIELLLIEAARATTADSVGVREDRSAVGRLPGEPPASADRLELARQRALLILHITRQTWRPEKDRLAQIESEAEHFYFIASGGGSAAAPPVPQEPPALSAEVADILPSTWYTELPAMTRVRLMVEAWQRATTVLNEMEAEQLCGGGIITCPVYGPGERARLAQEPGPRTVALHELVRVTAVLTGPRTHELRDRARAELAVLDAAQEPGQTQDFGGKQSLPSEGSGGCS